MNGDPNPSHMLQPCPTFDAVRTPDMAQSGGCPPEALGAGGDTVADCGLCLTPRTENLLCLLSMLLFPQQLVWSRGAGTQSTASKTVNLDSVHTRYFVFLPV